MPQWADFDKLPYVNAIIKEGMRWRPAVATGIPRRVAADDWYEGMFIPKDSTIFIPIYAIQHSERDGYGDPNEFNPDRYEGFTKLANDYAGSADYTQRDHYGYGSGRRMCPGIHLAERNQWRIAAKVLWAFEIQEPTDPITGEVQHLDPAAYTEGLLHAPLPYKAVFKPRSKAHAETIRKEYATAIKTLKQWE
jgi:cytochrome P450